MRTDLVPGEWFYGQYGARPARSKRRSRNSRRLRLGSPGSGDVTPDRQINANSALVNEQHSTEQDLNEMNDNVIGEWLW